MTEMVERFHRSLDELVQRGAPGMVAERVASRVRQWFCGG